MRQFILHPLFAPAFIILYVLLAVLYILIGGATDTDFINAFTSGAMEYITYAGYAVTACIALWFIRDFQTPKLRLSYAMYLFLLACAVLREMGAQHWIPSKDSTAFKIRFFTNPNNPIGEKILAASILALVIGVVLYLLIKYTKPLMRGFFKFHPICWTVASLGGIAVVSKFIDRFPSNYYKAVGTKLEPLTHAWSVLIEESSEATIPLMFAIAVIQWHLSCKKNY